MNDVLPDNGGYVVAAYLVFLALLLIYLAITALKFQRLERDLAELTELADRELAEDERAARGDAPAETRT